VSTQINIQSDDGYQMRIVINQPAARCKHALRGYDEHPFSYRLYARIDICSFAYRSMRPVTRSQTWRISPGNTRKFCFDPFPVPVLIPVTEHERLQETFFAACNRLRRWTEPMLNDAGKAALSQSLGAAHQKISQDPESMEVLSDEITTDAKIPKSLTKIAI
jgi:hypothetical protein